MMNLPQMVDLFSWFLREEAKNRAARSDTLHDPVNGYLVPAFVIHKSPVGCLVREGGGNTGVTVRLD